MSLTDDHRWSQMHEFHFARVLRARAMLGKQVMSRTCVGRYSALSTPFCSSLRTLASENSDWLIRQ